MGGLNLHHALRIYFQDGSTINGTLAPVPRNLRRVR